MYKFLGIGAQKAGTTWLYEMLRQHPDISFPLNKEVHYWNKAYPNLSVEKYFSNFQHPELNEGEITPAYSFLAPKTIEEIHRHQPNLKIFYIIRNPIDRAWSSAKMALARAEMEFNEASDGWFIDHFNSKGSILRGDYEACLRKWSNIFDYKQILVIRFEELQLIPNEVLSKCCQHLGIKKFEALQLELMNTDQAIFSTLEHKANSYLKNHLFRLYQKKISHLEDYLGFDLSDWKE